MASSEKVLSPFQPQGERDSSSTPLPPYSPTSTEISTSTNEGHQEPPVDTRLEDGRIIRLPCIDIQQNGKDKTECDLLLDLLDGFRQQWQTSHPAMEHLKTSLITTIAVWDQRRAYYASDFHGGQHIYRIVGRFRRLRPGQEPIDACLVLWKAMFISQREKAVLRETHRYRIKEISGPDDKMDIVRVKWCASWEPVKNLPKHMWELDDFSADVERGRRTGDNVLDFDIDVGSYDLGPYCGCDFHPYDS